jgi:hypothetical protein
VIDASITPTFMSSSSCEFVGDECWGTNFGPPLFTLLQLEMSTYGALKGCANRLASFATTFISH